MTKRERVCLALAHQQPDTVPYGIELTSKAMEAFTARYGIGKADFFDFAGSHIEKIGYNGGQNLDARYFQDDFGVVWDRGGGDDIGVVGNYLLCEPDIEGFKCPAVQPEEIKRITGRALANGRDSFKLAKIGMLLFERAWSLRSMEELLVDFYENEAFAAGLLAKITDYNVAVINEALKYPVDGFYFGDDYGQQNGLITGAPLWRKFVKPELARAFVPIKAKGLPVFLHSCGDITDILDDLVEIGLDCYQTVQPEIYDLRALKSRYGARLAFYGAISTQRFLPSATADAVRSKIAETTEILGESGGYICAPTHQIPGDVPPENIMAMITALKR